MWRAGSSGTHASGPRKSHPDSVNSAGPNRHSAAPSSSTPPPQCSRSGETAEAKQEKIQKSSETRVDNCAPLGPCCPAVRLFHWLTWPSNSPTEGVDVLLLAVVASQAARISCSSTIRPGLHSLRFPGPRQPLITPPDPLS